MTIEIFAINLRPGTREKFHQLYLTQSVPLQKKWKIEVLAHGPSLHDENNYYAVRRFKNLETRQKTEDAFYSSDDWQKGPRTAMLSMIENYVAIVVPEESLEEWLKTIKK